MTDDFELLDGVDAPRPLPADLRARLEQQLLADFPPRALSVEQRADLLAVLPRRRAWWPAAAGAAGLAASVAVALALTSSGSPTPRPAAAPALTVGSAAPSGGALGAGQTTGGRAGGGAVVGSGTGSRTGQAPTVVTGPVPEAPRGVTSPVPTPGGIALGQRSFPSPHLAAVTPSSGPLEGGTRVRLTGEGLENTTQVLFGDREGTGLIVDADGSLSVLPPAMGSPRSVTVTVVLSDSSRTSRSPGFSYRTG